MVTSDQVTEALRTVLDPELSLSVVDLGLIYGVAIEGRTVRITMTLTAPGCPLHDVMTDWVRRAVLGVPGPRRRLPGRKSPARAQRPPGRRPGARPPRPSSM